VLRRPDLAEDARYATTPQRVANREALVPEIARILRGQPIDHWMPLLRDANVPAGPINDFRQVFDDPQIRHREVVQEIDHPLSGRLSMVGNPLKFSETPVEYRRAPPLLGQHTGEVLRELLALDDAAISQLAMDGVIGQEAIS
jgi:crotonobetainyl-CoA:carnitine CoA-transferase CaiB-like acyl-CoA transferase